MRRLAAAVSAGEKLPHVSATPKGLLSNSYSPGLAAQRPTLGKRAHRSLLSSPSRAGSAGPGGGGGIGDVFWSQGRLLRNQPWAMKTTPSGLLTRLGKGYRLAMMVRQSQRR